MNRARTTLALATLAALGLASPRPAAAQGVNLVLGSGDALTVSGAGTTGTYHLLPVMGAMTTYTSYTNNDRENASGNYAAVETDGTASFNLAVGGTVTDANGEYGLYATGSGPVSLAGGSINATSYGFESEYGLYSTGSSPITVSAGSITEGDYVTGIQSEGSSLLTLSGGTITSGYSADGVYATGSAGLILAGAAITGGDYGVDFEDGGAITMTAGSISTLPSTTDNQSGQYGLYASDDGRLTLSGGTISGGTPSDVFSGTAVDAESTNVLLNGATLSSTGYTGTGLEIHGTTAVTMTSGSIIGGDEGYGLFDFSSSGTVSISGGTISAGQNSAAVDIYYGTAMISGGTISGGSGTVGVNAEGNSTVAISGGTISGGVGGDGVDVTDTSAVTISNGTISGGGSDGSGYGDGVKATGSGSVAISGGTITAGNGASGVENDGSGSVAISGGSITGRSGVDSEGTGTVTISGGTVTVGQNGLGVEAGAGQVIISGGTISAGAGGNGVEVVGSGTVTVSGGTINAGAGGIGIFALNSGTATISGGTINGGSAGPYFNDVVQTEYGTVTVTGGTLTAGAGGDVFFDDGGTILVSGGRISGSSGVTGMTSYDLIDLFGTDWTFTPTGGAPTAIASGELPGGLGTLMGTLLDGSAFDLSYDNEASIEVNVGTPPAAAPEPSQYAAFAIGLLGLGVLAVKAHKRTA